MNKQEKEFYQILGALLETCCYIDEIQNETCGSSITYRNEVFFHLENCHSAFTALETMIAFAYYNENVLPSFIDLRENFLSDDFSPHSVTRQHVMQFDEFLRWITFHNK